MVVSANFMFTFSKLYEAAAFRSFNGCASYSAEGLNLQRVALKTWIVCAVVTLCGVHASQAQKLWRGVTCTSKGHKGHHRTSCSSGRTPQGSGEGIWSVVVPWWESKTWRATTTDSLLPVRPCSCLMLLHPGRNFLYCTLFGWSLKVGHSRETQDLRRVFDRKVAWRGVCVKLRWTNDVCTMFCGLPFHLQWLKGGAFGLLAVGRHYFPTIATFVRTSYMALLAFETILQKGSWLTAF